MVRLIERFSSKPIIISILVLFSLSAIALAIHSSNKSKAATIKLQTETLTRVINIASSNIVDEVFQSAQELAQSIQKNKEIRSALSRYRKGLLTDSDVVNLSEILNEQFRQRFVTAGIVDLAKIKIYDLEFKSIAMSTEGSAIIQPEMFSAIKDIASARERKDRQKPLPYIWQSESPFISIVLPLGGLRLSGYVEVVLHPAYNLKEIAKTLSSPIKIETLDRQALFTSENWVEDGDNQSIVPVEYILTNNDNAPILVVTAQENIQAFTEQLSTIQKNTTLSYIVLGIVSLVASFVLLKINLFTPINTLMQAMVSVTNGQLDTNIKKLDRKDELGKMSHALVFFIDLFKENKKISEDALRVQTALESSPIATLMTDKDNKIVFVNLSMKDKLANFWGDFSSIFNGKELYGANIQDVVKDRSIEEKMTPSSHQKNTVIVGGRTFELIGSPVRNKDNELIGNVSEWRDITEVLAQQKEDEENKQKEIIVANENKRIRDSLNDVSTGVIILETDFKVIFSNKSSLSICEGVGFGRSEIDLFIQEIPGYLKNEFINGFEGETFELKNHVISLTASSVKDDLGKVLGIAIELKDISAEKAIEKELEGVIENAAKGLLDSKIKTENKDGFFLNLANQLNLLLENVSLSIDEVCLVISSISQGDLSKNIEGQYEGKFLRLKEDTNATISKLGEVLSSIKTSSELVVDSSQEIAKGNSDLSVRTNQEAAELEQTSSAVEEMNATTKSIAESSSQTLEQARKTQEVARQGKIAMEQVTGAMNEISDASKEVVKITSVISSIAFQTNLLSLNASVEAARAGDKGKGFAVVANEVRNLSQSSSSASKDIAEQLNGIHEKIQNGQQYVIDTDEKLQKITSAFDEVMQKMEESSRSIQEQLSGVAQISSSINHIDKSTQENAQLVDEVSATSASMTDMANQMRNDIEFFRLSEG